MFDVGVRTNIRKAAYFRVNDLELSTFVRKVQDDGNYVFSVIPLFRPKKKDEIVISDGVAHNIGEPMEFIGGYVANDDFDGF